MRGLVTPQAAKSSRPINTDRPGRLQPPAVLDSRQGAEPPWIFGPGAMSCDMAPCSARIRFARGARSDSKALSFISCRLHFGDASLRGTEIPPLEVESATLTRPIITGTSTSGPMTAANAAPESMPNTATATAIASSKLLLAAVKASVAVFE